MPSDQQRHVILAMILLGLFMTALATLPANLMNLRYLSFIYGTSYLLSGLGWSCLLTLALASRSVRWRHWTLIAATAIIIVAMFADFRNFHRMFVNKGLDDLAVIRIIDQVFK